MVKTYGPPLVSVLVPCHDAAPWIEATLRSVARQTYPSEAIEIIVVDDGSVDDSPSRVEALRLPNLRLLRTAHGGASRARNIATAEAAGNFIQYLDADDLLLPTALEQRVQALQRSGGDVAYSDWRRLVEEGGKFRRAAVERRKVEDVSRDTELALFTAFWSPPAALLYRREITRRVGGWNESLSVIQDARFLLDAAMEGARFVHVPEILSEYRDHRAGSLSKRDPLEFSRDILLNTEQVEGHWQARGVLTHERRVALANAYRHCALSLFWHDASLFSHALRRAERLGGARAANDPLLLYRWMTRTLGYRTARGLAAPVRAACSAGRSVLRPAVRALRRWEAA